MKQRLKVQGSACETENFSNSRTFSSREATPLFSQLQELRLLGRSNTGSPWLTDFPLFCACSESSLTKLIGWEHETNSLRMFRKLDPARGRYSWCWPKGARPLGMRMTRENKIPHDVINNYHKMKRNEDQSIYMHTRMDICLLALLKTSGHIMNIYVYFRCKLAMNWKTKIIKLRLFETKTKKENTNRAYDKHITTANNKMVFISSLVVSGWL